MPMNPEVKKLWTDARRSGEYKQAKHVLCAVDQDGNKSYCCLGVLCDLAIKADISVEVEQCDNNFGSYIGPILIFNKSRAMPPIEVYNWSGLPHEGISVVPGELAELNDGGATFAEIADKIDATL